MPPGLEVKVFAPEGLVVDPIAIDLDASGTLYVTSTSRNNMPLDIRQHQTGWPRYTRCGRAEPARLLPQELAPDRNATRISWMQI